MYNDDEIFASNTAKFQRYQFDFIPYKHRNGYPTDKRHYYLITINIETFHMRQ